MLTVLRLTVVLCALSGRFVTVLDLLLTVLPWVRSTFLVATAFLALVLPVVVELLLFTGVVLFTLACLSDLLLSALLLVRIVSVLEAVLSVTIERFLFTGVVLFTLDCVLLDLLLSTLLLVRIVSVLEAVLPGSSYLIATSAFYISALTVRSRISVVPSAIVISGHHTPVISIYRCSF